jgi:hypothetical protein
VSPSFAAFLSSYDRPGLLSSPIGYAARSKIRAFDCGSVTNGWAYAICRLPIAGRAHTVDYQLLEAENFGTHVLWTLERVGEAKVEIIKETLVPAIDMTPRFELFEPLFTTRLDRGHFPLPPLVIGRRNLGST